MWGAFCDALEAGIPSPRKFALAIRRAAADLRVSERQIQDDPTIRAYRDHWVDLRKDQAVALRERGDLTPTINGRQTKISTVRELAIVFDVTPRAIQRDVKEKTVSHLTLVPSDSQVDDNIARLERITEQFHAACLDLAGVAESLRTRFPNHERLSGAVGDLQTQMRDVAQSQ
jgi:hypothetical protein